MPDFKGVVEIQDSDGDPTLILDGNLGDLAIGGNGQDGQFAITTGAGVTKFEVDGSTGTITIRAADGDPIVTIDGSEGDLVINRKISGTNREVLRFDASDAALAIGGNGVEGDLTVRDGSGRDTLRFDGASAALHLGTTGNEGDLIIRNTAGQATFHLDGQTGNLYIRRDIGGTLRDVLAFNAGAAALYIGAEGNEGDLVIRDGAGRNVLHFDSAYAALYLGAAGNEGDLIVRNSAGDDTVKIDGNEGDIFVWRKIAGTKRQVFKFDASHAAMYIGSEGNEGDLIIRDGSGRDVFHFDSSYAVLDVGAAGNEGDIRVRDNDGDVRIHLDGNSGDIKLFGADCAEDFEVEEDEAIDQGTVLVIDDGGTLTACSREYDRTAAGVVSGAAGYQPGIVLGKRDDGRARVPVALLGRVFCKIDADFAPVAIGDLLTTSPTGGHAMKARDPRRTPGAVIGKAMGSLSSGRGLIPILVALQ